jgi:iron complex outermembrane receptor protein
VAGVFSTNESAPNLKAERIRAFELGMDAKLPGDMFSGGVEFLRGPWSGSLIANHIGHIYGSGDDTNINTVQGVFGSYDARTVLNAKVTYRYDRHVALALSADNLLNRQYFDFYKQPGMTAVAEVIVRF